MCTILRENSVPVLKTPNFTAQLLVIGSLVCICFVFDGGYVTGTSVVVSKLMDTIWLKAFIIIK
jgi:hypothetical protein